jgi:hypothetical protein
VLPLLYLHGLSTGDFVPALGQFLGSSAGLSAPVITKLTEAWKAEQRTFAARDLSGVDYVYLWVDGIHVNIRLEGCSIRGATSTDPRRSLVMSVASDAVTTQARHRLQRWLQHGGQLDQQHRHHHGEANGAQGNCQVLPHELARLPL